MTYQAAIGRNEPASLLEQHTPDFFSTSIGNIPAGETVKVEIEYVLELKHDVGVDGLRFTIPTSIALISSKCYWPQSCLRNEDEY